VLKVKVSFVDIFKLTSSDLAEDGFHPNRYNKIAKDSAIRSVNNSKTPDVITKRVGNDECFNADNQSDILYNSATGENTVWMMDGTNLAQNVATTL